MELKRKFTNIFSNSKKLAIVIFVLAFFSFWMPIVLNLIDGNYYAIGDAFLYWTNISIATVLLFYFYIVFFDRKDNVRNNYWARYYVTFVMFYTFIMVIFLLVWIWISTIGKDVSITGGYYHYETLGFEFNKTMSQWVYSIESILSETLEHFIIPILIFIHFSFDFNNKNSINSSKTESKRKIYRNILLISIPVYIYFITWMLIGASIDYFPYLFLDYTYWSIGGYAVALYCIYCALLFTMSHYLMYSNYIIKKLLV